MDKPKRNTRRRGEVLEEAILQAAWEELSQVGYSRLTMESVAARAGTNKAVLYRRWKNKSELVIAAGHKYSPRFLNEIPNTGSLRGDVYEFLHGLVEPLKSIGPQTIRGLMMEPPVIKMLVAVMSKIIQKNAENAENRLTALMKAILKNAELRGEVRLAELSPRIISLPLDLMYNEVITKQEVSDTAIAEIVDDIFLPLVYGHSSNRI